tara:strand:- start:56 stop:1363 length:1308 start_codon:yes stop_codon:yes gene_type:complete
MPFCLPMEIAELYQRFLASQGVFTDTRKPLPRGLFFALQGPNFNADSFAETALELGAIAAVVSKKKAFSSRVKEFIAVDDPLITLQQLANYHRRQLSTQIIALTGSNGKTTTKELMAAVLSSHFKTTATIGNLNNHIGVPLTLLAIPPDAEIAIIEMGANHLGEIANLSAIVEPDLGYITNFGKAHLEGFGGTDGVIKGKSELYRYLKKNQKKAFINGDDAKQMELSQNLLKSSFGTDSSCAFQVQYESHPDELIVKTAEGNLSSPLHGSYNLPNIAAAYALGKHFQVPFKKIKSAIEAYQAVNNRSQCIENEGTVIILDAYNANPSSMKAALDSFYEQFTEDRVVILGDMLELGEYKEKEHKELANYIKQKDHEKVVIVGEVFSSLQISIPNMEKHTTTSAFLSRINPAEFKGKNILIKGSRGLAMERIVKKIT